MAMTTLLQPRVLQLCRKCDFRTLQPIRQIRIVSANFASSTADNNEEMTNKTRLLAQTILTSEGSDKQRDTETHRNNLIKRRVALSRAITLVESQAPGQRRQGDLLLNHLLAKTYPKEEQDPKYSSTDGRETSSKNQALGQKLSTFRLGIAGPPGAGKSSFVETLGLFVLATNKEKSDERDSGSDSSRNSSCITGAGSGENITADNATFHPSKLAVLCIDPSSVLGGGSILGDKTRMQGLSRNVWAYVRPSPTRGALGGLSAYTADAVSLCEAAGYDLVIIETVGLGQSEVEIAQGVDMLILIVPPGGGDELQGVKKGIIEVADMLVVNKADGNLLPAARSTAADYRGAMKFLRQRKEGWAAPPVLLASAHTGDGVAKVWEEICRYRALTNINGEWHSKRRRQSRYWMWKTLRELISERTKNDPVLRARAEAMEDALDRGAITPRVAASELLESLIGEPKEGAN